MSHPSIRPWAGALAVVHELTGQPIESATVSLVGMDSGTQTGRYGSFAFPDVQPGLVSVRVTSPEHPSVVQEVEVKVKADRLVFVRFVLPSITAVLSELFVGVPRDRPSVAEALTAADLLAIKVPSARVTSGIIGKNNYPIRLWGFNSLTRSSEPLVLIDGVIVSSIGHALEALRQIPAEHVEDIEVLRGPVAAFLFPYAAGGVVLVTTRSGGGR